MKTERDIYLLAESAIDTKEYKTLSDTIEDYRSVWAAGYTACQEEDRWISVEERFPADFVPVLTIDSNSEIRVLEIQYFGEGSYFEWCDIDTIDKSHENITHWQPLPNPPKK